MRKKVSLFLVMFFAVVMAFPTEAKASGNYSGEYDYVIDDYDVDIKVNEDNTFDITETISVYYNVSKHGIYRTIPAKNEVVRLDGSRATNKAQISDISVNEEFAVEREDGDYKIKIGSADYLVDGVWEYVISYHYNIGKDTLKDGDELYYNIIGTGWDTLIQNVTFRITMPKDFDADKLGFAAGMQGSTESKNVSYEVDGRVIKGSYNGFLRAGEGLTVRLELPEGYFEGAGYDINILTFVVFLVPFLAFIISVILWFIYGMDDMSVETVEFYPPEGMNSLQMAFIYKGKAENKDVISLLVYMAGKGYLKITEAQEKAFIGTKNGFMLTKLKDYDGYDFCERTFLKGLFKSKNVVRLSDLEDEFYKTMNRILSEVNKKEFKNKIFEKASGRKSIWVVLLLLISVLTILAIPTLEYGDTTSLGMTLFLALFYTPFYAVTFIKGMPTIFRLFWGGFTFVHSMAFFSTMPIADAIMHDRVYLVSTLFGVACIIGMIVCIKQMPKRTTYGRRMYGKIKGFKNFLETAEKAKLEELVFENPSYFYDILPYTYVLGISDKWIEKFETIAIRNPDWYSGTGRLNMGSFDKMMRQANESMAPQSSGSSGGSSRGSGGGSSGGGSGGGGGGSW